MPRSCTVPKENPYSLSGHFLSLLPPAPGHDQSTLCLYNLPILDDSLLLITKLCLILLQAHGL